ARCGSFRANPFGLFDMAGNTWDWCSDWYSSGYYAKSPAADPAGPASGSSRVVRGGCWNYGPDSVRAGYRGRCDPATVSTASVFACVALLEFSPVILMGFGLWQLCRSVL
ncbi:MAG: formylglycine-generating enzyme family protein, partial [Planctomyces sp.]